MPRPQPSTCTCAGPGKPSAGLARWEYVPGAAVAVEGAVLWGAAELGIDLRRVPGGLDAQRFAGSLGLGLGVGALALAAIADLADVVLGVEAIPDGDVRHASAHRKATLRERFAKVAPVPADEVDRVLLRERLHDLLAANRVPADSCGWYRYGWATQGHLMEAVLEDVSVGAALAAMADADDDAALMRLAGVTPEIRPCPRFWFGVRDSNDALAAAVKDAGLMV